MLIKPSFDKALSLPNITDITCSTNKFIKNLGLFIFCKIYYPAKASFPYQIHMVDTHVYPEGVSSYKCPDEIIINC